MTILSLTTDFGNLNGFVGTMKGVIYSICPEVKIADITHEIPAQDIRTGAIALWRASAYFPKGSVHVAVIDPGVGTKRRAIAAKLGDQYYVMPDNGLITPMLEDAEAAGLEVRIVHLDKPDYWLPQVYTTFHGRDIFAPVGAHLAAGVPLEMLGTVIDDPVRLPLPKPVKTDEGIEGSIVVIDVFGNCSTNVRVSEVADLEKASLSIAGHVIRGVLPSYGHAKIGDLVAVTDSEGFIEVAVVNGSAAKTYGIRLDDTVRIQFNA
jgi:S-adenosylmethionine hydrolase